MSLVEAIEVRLGPGTTVVQGSFAVPAGRTAVLGPNGSGKTTLLQALQGFPLLQGGDLRMEGRSIPEIFPRDLAQLLAIVPQELPTAVHQSVEATIGLGLLAEVGWWKPLPLNSAERVSAVMEQLGLVPLRDRPVDQLSTGERQKVFLGQALVRRPKLLLLDEPTSHLDPGATERFWESVPSIPSLVVSHDLHFAKQRCDWVLALRHGEVFYCGASAEFFAQKLDGLLYA